MPVLSVSPRQFSLFSRSVSKSGGVSMVSSQPNYLAAQSKLYIGSAIEQWGRLPGGLDCYEINRVPMDPRLFGQGGTCPDACTARDIKRKRGRGFCDAKKAQHRRDFCFAPVPLSVALYHGRGCSFQRGESFEGF